jgi:RNA polymerase sigma-70 factor (ECF subfamily)
MGSKARSTAASQTPSDGEIVERAKKGDREAFGILVHRYQGRAFRLALRVLRDEEQARDAVQDSFLKAYRSIDRFEGRSSFYTWLYRLVMNRCIDQKRRDKSKSDRHVEWDEERSLDASEGAVAGTAPPSRPDDELFRAELRKRISEAIGELPDEARRTFELREVDGLDYAEIAAALRIPKGTVMSRLHYARRRLRAVLLEAGGVEPEGAQ